MHEPLDHVSRGACKSFHRDAAMEICIFAFGFMLLGWFCCMQSLRLASAHAHAHTDRRLGSVRSTDLVDYNSVEMALSTQNYVRIFIVMLTVQYVAPSCRIQDFLGVPVRSRTANLWICMLHCLCIETYNTVLLSLGKGLKRIALCMCMLLIGRC